jgi:uncharacterized membrane protein HdeD (DUF308 family)
MHLASGYHGFHIFKYFLHEFLFLATQLRRYPPALTVKASVSAFQTNQQKVLDMNMGNLGPYRAAVRHELDALQGHWRWFVIFGLALVVLGAETVAAFWCRAWSGFTLLLLSGLLSIVVGVMFLQAPIGALVALTLLVACLLIVGGAFKIVAAISYQFAAWGWPLASGAIDLILGLLIWQQWPACSFWVIGLFVGINFIFRGFNWVGLGLSLRALVKSPPTRLGPASESLAGAPL